MPQSSAQFKIERELWTEQELLEAIRDGTAPTVVTGNARAARALRQRYNQWQHGAGNTGWRTAGVTSWDAWLVELWETAAMRGSEARALLNDAQEAEIWCSIVEADENTALAALAGGLAASVQKAWTEMQHYRVPLHSMRSDDGVDAMAFIRWAGEFESRCRKNFLLSASQLESEAAGWVKSRGVNPPQELLLTGFDRITPAQAALFDALREYACRIRHIALRRSDDSVVNPAIVMARTQTEEAEAAAHWIRERLLANPEQQIGVISPSLAQQRASIDAVFRRILAPSSFEIGDRRPFLPYEFSLGTPMRLVWEIRTALLLLRWAHAPLQPEEISWLLVHGEFSGKRVDVSADSTEEAENRAKIDRQFRDRKFQLGGPVSFPTFRQWLLHEGNGRESARFKGTLQRFLIAVQGGSLKKARSFGDWREEIERLLAAADWSLLNSVASRDFQLLARWNKLLDKFSTLNAVTGAVKFEVAVERLEQLAAQTLFSLESRNAPVQILGVLESSGMLFDAVWWMGTRAGDWPTTGRAQPFLPWSVQREAGMPHTDPESDYAFAVQVTERILSSGGSVIASFAQETADAEDAGAHLRDREAAISPVLRKLLPDAPIVDAANFLPSSSAEQQKSSFWEMEHVHEEPPAPLQSRSVRGGVAFLEQQAACPFRAFAELRLAGQPLCESDAGLSRRDQGTVVHRVLQQFWNDVKSQSEMLKKSSDELRGKLRECIARALAGFSRSAAEPWQQALLQVEAERLENRLMLWLEKEKSRPAFEVVAEEDTVKGDLSGVEFDCRIDRIDRVPQGLVLIDYKTGEATRASCTGERPDKPQLPAYAVLRNNASAEPLAAVAFARLQPKELGFEIVSSAPNALEAGKEALNHARTKQKEDWKTLSPEQMQEQQEIWKQALMRLAEDFRSGMAVVDPKKGGETCRYCAQELLCRVQESSSLAAEFPDDGNDDLPFDGSNEMEFQL